MGNKSKKRKPLKTKTGEIVTPKWTAVRRVAEAGQARTSRDWQGMKEKTVSPKSMTGRRYTMPVLYKSSSGVPKRKKPAAKLEINRTPQPWQKKREETGSL